MSEETRYIYLADLRYGGTAINKLAVVRETPHFLYIKELPLSQGVVHGDRIYIPHSRRLDKGTHRVFGTVEEAAKYIVHALEVRAKNIQEQLEKATMDVANFERAFYAELHPEVEQG
jgi:hypothetical protein